MRRSRDWRAVRQKYASRQSPRSERPRKQRCDGLKFRGGFPLLACRISERGGRDSARRNEEHDDFERQWSGTWEPRFCGNNRGSELLPYPTPVERGREILRRSDLVRRAVAWFVNVRCVAHPIEALASYRTHPPSV